MGPLDAVEAGIAAIGARFGPDVLERTRALYRPLVTAAAADWACAVAPDLSYGPDPRHRLDLFLPQAGGTPAPVMLFVHGGGFVGGDKAEEPLFYANVGAWFARRGWLAATGSYRLAGQAGWPAGSEDVAAMAGWLAANAAAHGGDPRRIAVIGQSAGAAHVAGYLFHPRFAASGREALLGAALMSGFYRAEPPLAGGPRLYFGEDEAQWPDRSPAAHAAAGHVPLMLSLAQYDPAPIAAHTLDLAAALNRVDGSPPELHWFGRHNHVSTVHGIGLEGDRVGPALEGFFARL